MNLISFCVLALMSVPQQTIPKLSLEDYGWSKAKTGEQRATVIYRAQRAAVNEGGVVDYSGLTEIDLEITEKFKTIPLTGRDDFSGITFNVTNKAQNTYLFSRSNRSVRVNVPKNLLDGDDFTSVPELAKGEVLLIIEDQNLWVDNRAGREYGHTRKDILLIKDGKSQNKVIAPYDNEESSPKCSYVRLDDDAAGYVRNFTLNRMSGSTKITDCIKIQGQCHFTIKGVTINTPESKLTQDRALRVQDCADITFEDVVINGSYSTTTRYGYGININNAWNVLLHRVKGSGTWGVMGTHNLSNARLVDCDMNRFDIHCYGRDYSLTDCRITGWFSGGSSVFGNIRYERCVFTNTIPLEYGRSYKTSVGAEVLFKDCIFNVTKNRNAVFSSQIFKYGVNERKGLTQRCLPNITIQGMTINVPKGVDKVYVYDIPGVQQEKKTVGYIGKIVIEDLRIVCEDEGQNLSFLLSSSAVPMDAELKVEIRNLAAPNATLNVNMTKNQRNHVMMQDVKVKNVQPTSSLVSLSAPASTR